MKKERIILEAMTAQIRGLMNSARDQVLQQVHQEQLMAYWNIGRVIVEHEQNSQERSEDENKTWIQLSAALSAECGEGFSRSDLQKMRDFYLAYPNVQTLSGYLSWSHYCELLTVVEPERRSFYEKECVRSEWSVRELKDQISPSLDDRPLLSDGTASQDKGQELSAKDPSGFEFIRIPENQPVLEDDLKKALERQIEKFMLELGRSFMFVGTRQRVDLNNQQDDVDMVFYNKQLHAYVLIVLKTAKFMPEAVGQFNRCLNDYAAEVNEPNDNPPVGIILCIDRNYISVAYALAGLSDEIFTSTYLPVLPEKEAFMAQVEAVLKRWDKDEG